MNVDSLSRVLARFDTAIFTAFSFSHLASADDSMSAKIPGLGLYVGSTYIFMYRRHLNEPSANSQHCVLF